MVLRNSITALWTWCFTAQINKHVLSKRYRHALWRPYIACNEPSCLGNGEGGIHFLKIRVLAVRHNFFVGPEIKYAMSPLKSFCYKQKVEQNLVESFKWCRSPFPFRSSDGANERRNDIVSSAIVSISKRSMVIRTSVNGYTYYVFSRVFYNIFATISYRKIILLNIHRGLFCRHSWRWRTRHRLLRWLRTSQRAQLSWEDVQFSYSSAITRN